SLGVSAPAAHILYVSVFSAYWSPYRMMRRLPLPEYEFLRSAAAKRLFRLSSPFLEPFFLAYHAAPLNALRRKHGLPPFRNFAEGFTFGDFTLYADLPSLVPVTGLP